MRTLTTLQSAALASPNRSTSYRVWVDSTGSGTYVNLSSISGYDFLRDVSYGTSVDQPVATASIRLARSVFQLSLNPLMGTSKLNNGQALIDEGRRIYVEQATVMLDAPVQSSQWVRVFDGYVDDIDATGEIMSVECRDLAALLQDTYIETERTYGSSLGVALQTVIQSILDDNINTPGLGSVTLYVPTAPTFLVLPFKQSKVNVMDAITALADQIGWAIRYRWDSGTSAFRLTLYTPDRANTTPDYIFGPDDYYDIKALKVSRKDVRNVVQVVYDDKSVSTTSPLRQKVIATDTASTTRYKRRWMELAEAATSQIDTAAEASAMANAALSDLSTPYADHEVELDYFFAVELGDLYAFQPNGQHYDAQQKFAVVGIKHDLTAEGSYRTTLTTRGKPSTGYKRWLRMEGRPGVAPNAGAADPSPPSTVSAVAALGSVTIECTPPDTANWSRTEIFMDTNAVAAATTTNGKYNSVGEGLLVAKGKQTKFSILGLVPGTTYYGRVQVLDRDNNRSAASGQFTVTTETVSAYHTNPDNTFPILNGNSDFNAFTKGTNLFPDAWGPDGTNSVWGSGQTVYFDTAAASGKFCVVLYTGARGLSSNTAGGGAGGIRTSDGASNLPSYIPFAANEVLCCGAYIKWAAMPSGVTSLEVMLEVRFYDASKTLISSTSKSVVASSANIPTTSLDGWYLITLGTTTPTNCRYVSVHMRRYGRDGDPIGDGTGVNPWGTGAAQPGLYIDRITLTRGNPALSSDLSGVSGNQYIVPNQPTAIETFDASGDTFLGFRHSVGTNSSAAGGGNYTIWSCLLACTVSVTFTCNVTALNVARALHQVWIEIFSLVGGRQIATTSFFLDQGESQDITLSVAAVSLLASDQIVAYIQNTHECNVLNSSVSLNVISVDRKDK